MADNNNKVVKKASSALDSMKYEIANEVGVTLNQGYNGNISAKDAGRVGGNMTRRLIKMAEDRLAGNNQK